MAVDRTWRSVDRGWLVDQVVDEPGVRYRGYIVVSLLTGARAEELRALTWDHVDLDGQHHIERPLPPSIEVWHSTRDGRDTKARKSRRTLALPERCVLALRSQHQQKRKTAPNLPTRSKRLARPKTVGARATSKPAATTANAQPAASQRHLDRKPTTRPATPGNPVAITCPPP